MDRSSASGERSSSLSDTDDLHYCSHLLKWTGRHLVEREALYYLKFKDTPFSGELEGVQQGKISEGKKQGPWLEFWVTGQLKSKGEYIDGKKTGLWLSFYTNGQLMRKGNYLENIVDGDWLYYFRDGTINQQSSGKYKDGKKLNSN